MVTQFIPSEEIKVIELIPLYPLLNEYLKQELKGKTLLLANKEQGEEFKETEDCEVIYLTESELKDLDISFMKYHNVVTHNFNHLAVEVLNIQKRCEKAKIRFIAFKDLT